VIMTVQLPLAGTGVPTAQVPPVIAKSARFAPGSPMAMTVKLSGIFPVFITVVVFWTLAGLTGTVPNITGFGDETITAP